MYNKLTERLFKLGLPLFEKEDDFDVHETLSAVVKNREARLWEAFPVLLANANKEYLFDYKKVFETLTSREEKDCFYQLLLLSLAFYKYKHLKFWWATQLYNELSKNMQNEVMDFLSYFRGNQDFLVYGKKLSPDRMDNVFASYFEEVKSELDNLYLRHNELHLDYALSQLFSPKQKELFLKKVRGQKMNKTEKEYFSRTVRKKLVALANSELQKLVESVLGF